MTTDIATSTIVQQACRIMEVTPPSSFEDSGELAGALKQQYPRARDIALEGYDWSFVRRLRALPPAELQPPDVTDPDLPFAFTLPAECLKLRHVYSVDGWRLDERTLRTDTPENVLIRFTARNEREADWPETFQLAVAYQLAMLLAPRFVTTRTKRDSIRSEMADVWDAAKRADTWTASHHRIDGLSDTGDWVAEAML